MNSVSEFLVSFIFLPIYLQLYLFVYPLTYFISLLCFHRMIQSAFVDMESMFNLLTEEKEVSGHYGHFKSFCSQVKGKSLSNSIFTSQLVCTEPALI